jgi:homoserine kinase type II
LAVYTEFSDEEFEAFIAAYDIGTVTAVKGIAEGVENSNYLLSTAHSPYILTLYERRVAEADLPFFLCLMEHLAARGIACPVPVRDRRGNALNRLAARPAAIVTFLQGMSVRRPSADHCAALGRALADLHIAGDGFAMKRRNALSVEGWRPLYQRCAERAHEVAPGLSAEIEAELAVLESEWPQDLPAGIIHADLFPDNVFFLSGRLSGLIDFYFACNDLLAYDLAICLNAWCFETDGSLNVTKARSLLTGYQLARPLAALEVAALPTLARGAAMRFLLTRLFDWMTVPKGALVVPKDPAEYLRKLRFHRGVRDASAYGLGLP